MISFCNVSLITVHNKDWPDNLQSTCMNDLKHSQSTMFYNDMYAIKASSWLKKRQTYLPTKIDMNKC